MKRYRCLMCGYIYDETKEGAKFTDLPDSWTCPMCGVPKSMFEEIEEETAEAELPDIPEQEISSGTFDADGDISEYLQEYAIPNDDKEIYMSDIHQMAKTGKSIIAPMSTAKPVVSWDDILIMGNQLNPPPLLESEEVSLKTVIGKNAKKPMTIESPVYITHMSFGALSKRAKIALSKGSAAVKTAMASGEGGILPEEKENAYRYIFEIIPNMYSVTDENLKSSDAIEIKIGQGTKPGMGGHLPGAKVTAEIAKVRGKIQGEDIISPSKFPDINSKDDLKAFVTELRERSEGRPIGIKIAAGRIEDDLEYVTYAEPDFITIDGRGGATGASPKIIRDSTSLPTIYALYRAKKYLDEHGLDIDLIITGGFRVSSDIAKALAMGAKAVAIGTSAMIAIACQQYRICQSGKCPVGVATQDSRLESRIDIEKSAKRLTNYLTAVNDDLKTFARITGHHDIHQLSKTDIITTNREISEYTDIRHA